MAEEEEVILVSSMLSCEREGVVILSSVGVELMVSETEERLRALEMEGIEERLGIKVGKERRRRVQEGKEVDVVWVEPTSKRRGGGEGRSSAEGKGGRTFSVSSARLRSFVTSLSSCSSAFLLEHF